MSGINASLSVCRGELAGLQASGAQLLEVIQSLQRRGRNVLSALIGSQPSVAWTHYPEDDAFDADSGYRYYYHAHPGPRASCEHGHFHLFAKASEHSAEHAVFTHLLAVGVSADGLPVRGFTTNRWVTNEHWRPAAEVIRRASGFRLDKPARLAPVNQWLQALMGLFRPQLRWLLTRRDEVWQRALQTRPNFFEDRRSTVLSECAFDLHRQFAWLDRLDGAPA